MVVISRETYSQLSLLIVVRTSLQKITKMPYQKSIYSLVILTPRTGICGGFEANPSYTCTGRVRNQSGRYMILIGLVAPVYQNATSHFP